MEYFIGNGSERDGQYDEEQYGGQYEGLFANYTTNANTDINGSGSTIVSANGTRNVRNVNIVFLGIFAFTMFFITIVLLNLLIALMGDIYEHIQDTSMQEFQMGRAKLLLELELIYWPEQLS